MPKNRIPSYRLHKATGQAVVVLGGKSIYLGLFGSPESRAKFDRIIARYLVVRNDPDKSSSSFASPSKYSATGAELLIGELVLRYWKFAKGYYVKNGRPTGEQHPLKQALRILRKHFGETLAAEFGPLALKDLRQAMVVHPITRKVKKIDPETKELRFEDKVIRVGLARRTINNQIGRVKRVFGWAVAEELLAPHVHEALCRVHGLRQGRTDARELPRVAPVSEEHVEAVLAVVSPTIGAMVRVQWLTGCRPHEVVLMRGVDFDVSGSVWEYRPKEYKTQHTHEDETTFRARLIFVGPKTQLVLAPFLAAAKGGYLFRPVRNTAFQKSESTKLTSKPRVAPAADSAYDLLRTALHPEHADHGSFRDGIAGAEVSTRHSRESARSG